MTKCKTCGNETPDTVVINGVEYETQTHDKGKKLSEIKIPKGWRLWRVSDFEKFSLDDYKKLNIGFHDTQNDFFIEQPIALNKDNWAAVFYVNSDRAFLSCLGGPALSDDRLGVRFARGGIEMTTNEEIGKKEWEAEEGCLDWARIDHFMNLARADERKEIIDTVTVEKVFREGCLETKEKMVKILNKHCISKQLCQFCPMVLKELSCPENIIVTSVTRTLGNDVNMGNRDKQGETCTNKDEGEKE